MRRLARFGPELLVVLGAALFAVVGRGRWADVFLDHGVWFSDAQGVLAGGRVLHEVRIQYGPMSVWILTGLLKVFGAHVSTVVVAQFLIGLAAILGVQAFCRRFLSPAERWFSAAGLVVVILWMSGPGNLLYPYAFAVSHALLGSVLAWELAARSGGHRRPMAAIVAAGVIVGLASATKQELGVVALLGVAFVVLASPGSPPRTRVIRLSSAIAAGAATYALTFAASLHGSRFIDVARDNLLWPWAPIPDSWRQLYRRGQGLDRPGQLLASVGDTMVIALVFGGSAWLILYGAKIARRRALVAGGIVLAGWVLWAWRWTEGSHFLAPALFAPLLAAASILGWIRASRVGRPGWETGAAFAAIAGAAVLLSREGFRGGIEGYYSGMGYVLAVPAVVPIVAAALRGPASAGRRRWIMTAVLGVLLWRAGAHRLAALRSHWDALVPFATARGTVHSDPSQTRFLEQEASLIESRTRRGDSILMIPITQGLDFLLDRRNESFFPNMVPGVIVGEDGDRELIERWKARPPRIVIESRGLGVFRSGEFGEGWGRAAQQWIEENYVRCPSIDPAGQTRVWELAPARIP